VPVGRLRVSGAVVARYKAAFTTAHASRSVFFGIMLCDSLSPDLPVFLMETWDNQHEWAVTLVDPSGAPPAIVKGGIDGVAGRLLRRDEAVSHSRSALVFQIYDRVVAGDVVISSFLGIS